MLQSPSQTMSISNCRDEPPSFGSLSCTMILSMVMGTAPRSSSVKCSVLSVLGSSWKLGSTDSFSKNEQTTYYMIYIHKFVNFSYLSYKTHTSQYFGVLIINIIFSTVMVAFTKTATVTSQKKIIIKIKNTRQ